MQIFGFYEITFEKVGIIQPCFQKHCSVSYDEDNLTYNIQDSKSLFGTYLCDEKLTPTTDLALRHKFVLGSSMDRTEDST